jgi:hypothetical protein
MTTLALESNFEMAPAAAAPRAGVGYLAGGIMILAAAFLWGSAFLQLRFLSPPIHKLTTNKNVGIAKQKDVEAFWSFPWRGVGSEAGRLAAGAIVVTIVVCLLVRTWWAWGAMLVAAPLLLNWYVSLCLLMPAIVVIDKMRL